MNLDSRDPREVPQITSHNLHFVKDGRGGDLQIGVRQYSPSSREVRLDLAEDACRRQVVGENGYRREDKSFYVLQVSLAIGRTKGAFVELADDNSARELLAPRDPRKPAEIPWVWPRSQNLGDRVRVEEIGQRRVLVEPDRPPWTCPTVSAHGTNEFLRASPSACEACEALFRPRCSQTLELLELRGRHKRRNRFSVARDQERIAPLSRPETVRKLCFRSS